MLQLGTYIKTQLKDRIVQIGKRLGELDISSIMSKMITDVEFRYSVLKGKFVLVYKTPGGEVEIDLDDDDDDDDDNRRYDDDDDW